MPTLDFPPAYIEQSVRAGVTTYTRRVDVYQADNTTLFARAVGLSGGTVKVDLGSDTRRSADLTLSNYDGRLDVGYLVEEFWYDKVLRVIMGIKHPSGNWETSLGTFLIDRIDGEDYSDELGVTCRDFSKKLARKLPYDLAWDVNTPIETIIQDMASGGGVPPSQTNLPITGVSTVEEKSFSANSDRWQSMREVATSAGFDLYFDVDGILVLESFTDPYTSQPQYSFQVGQFSNLAKIKRSIADNLIVNHWVVLGEDLEGNPVWGEAVNENINSPTNILRLGRRTDTYESAWVTDFDQAVEVAQRKLLYSSLERYECDLDTVIAPWLDVNITAEFDDPRASVVAPTRYLLATLDFDLGLGPVNAQVRRVTNVIDAAALYPDTDIYPEATLFPSDGTLAL